VLGSCEVKKFYFVMFYDESSIDIREPNSMPELSQLLFVQR